MPAHDPVDDLICLIATWDHETLKRQFLAFRGSFPVDLTPAFMDTLSVDRLRHIYLALCLQNRRPPTMAVAA